MDELASVQLGRTTEGRNESVTGTNRERDGQGIAKEAGSSIGETTWNP